MSKLKEEIGAMEKEHSELQQHIARTDWWCENLGHWRATIIAAEVSALYLFPAVSRWTARKTLTDTLVALTLQ